MRSLNERAMGLNEEGKTKWQPKSALSRGRFLLRNIVSKSMNNYHNTDPTLLSDFCLRILKTEFVSPKLSSGSISSSRSLASCADLQLYFTIRTEIYCQQTYRIFINCWTWNRAQIKNFTTNLGFIDPKIACLFGPEMMESFVAVFRTIAVFLLFLVVLHCLYTTQHKRYANYKGQGALQHRKHLRRSALISNADFFSLEHVRIWSLKMFIRSQAFHINPYMFQIRMF